MDSIAIDSVRFLLFKNAGDLIIQGERHAIPANSIVVTAQNAVVHTRSEGPLQFDFYAGDFQKLSLEIVDILNKTPLGLFHRVPVRIIKADEELIQVIASLAKEDNATMFRFMYVYCLGMDRRYFSSLLQHTVTGGQSFFGFIENNYLNAWSVARYTAELGISLRKFNCLFHEKYGVSAKHWLLERRLEHARELLISTSMRVIDIAMECGFSNHAHFTDSFKKHFGCNPTQFRHGSQWVEQVGVLDKPYLKPQLGLAQLAAL